MARLRGRGPTEAPTVRFERPEFHFTYEAPQVLGIEHINPRPGERFRKWARALLKALKKENKA